MPQVIRVTDETTAADLRDILKARCRRLMAERAALPPTWQHRADRRRLIGLIDDALDEWLACA